MSLRSWKRGFEMNAREKIEKLIAEVLDMKAECFDQDISFLFGVVDSDGVARIAFGGDTVGVAMLIADARNRLLEMVNKPEKEMVS